MNLENLIRRAFGNSANLLSSVEMERGASTRRYFRLSLGHAEFSTAVLMALPDDAKERGTGKELPFVNVQRYLRAASLKVPAIYLDAASEGAVLLEDLGTVTFNQKILPLDSASVERWYMAAVELLARMHTSMWPIPAGCVAAERYFDYKLLRSELDHFREFGVEARTGNTLTSERRALLDAAFDCLAAEIDALPKGFVHRDYQSRNLMVKGDYAHPDCLTVIDFQDAFIGPRTYDLVALLNDSYVEISDDTRERIIERYAVLRGLPVAEIRAEFHLITVQRKLKDGGRFVFMDKVRGDPSFLCFVDTSFARVASSLKQLEGHMELKQILAQAAPEFFLQV